MDSGAGRPAPFCEGEVNTKYIWYAVIAVVGYYLFKQFEATQAASAAAQNQTQDSLGSDLGDASSLIDEISTF